MAINFPNNRDQLVPPQPSGPIQTGDVYVYLGTTYTATVLGDGSVRWDAAVSAGSDAYVLKVGDTMTGQLTLPGGGTGNEAATVSQIPVVPAALWQRDGGTSTLSPATANDNLNQGTGDISGGNIQASGFTNALGGSYSRTGDTNNKLFIGQQTDFTEVFSVSNTGNVVATGDVQTTSLNSGPLAGFRNALVNGDFRIWQRGPGGATNPGINNELSYTADRWGQYGSAAATGDRGSDAPANGMFAQAISFSNCSLQQRIEIFENNSPFILGSTWTLSYYSKGGPLQIAIDASVIGGSSTTYVAATSPSTTSAPDANGFTYNTFTFTFSGSTAPNTHDYLTVAFIGPAADTRLTGVQLEPGPVSTPWEARPIQTELALCQRYFEVGRSRMLAQRIDTGANYFSNYWSEPFKQTKRAVPTLNVSMVGGGTFGFSANVNTLFPAGYVYNNESGGTTIEGDWTADAEL